LPRRRFSAKVRGHGELRFGTPVTLPGPRVLNLGAFAICAGLMGYALYAEHVLLLMPCPLCVFQRVAMIALGLVFLVAGLHGARAWGRYVYASLVAIAAAAGIVVAGRHVWLQHLPPDAIPACGPGLDTLLERFPLSEVLALVFTGSGECADVDWTFLGLSMPAWVLAWFVVLGVIGTWNNLRRPTIPARL
jgi:disulfide bond formation protein DsbB